MEQHHRDMATNTLVPGTESTAANKPEYAIALILRCDNPWVLNDRDCRVKFVPFWPKTGVMNLRLIVLFYHAHFHVEHQDGLVACHCPLLLGCHVLKTSSTRDARAQTPFCFNIFQAR
jgi:hypothetical protein